MNYSWALGLIKKRKREKLVIKKSEKEEYNEKKYYPLKKMHVRELTPCHFKITRHPKSSLNSDEVLGLGQLLKVKSSHLKPATTSTQMFRRQLPKAQPWTSYNAV